ncbi:uncharacterized protein LOC116346059 isoform X2 [Contarinia nasturtii]|uniref:uncharacterized protein LOC116346059 isoform X2 n=1 Tax=Contarinia nasturtii TaxID=265458 RepID=UPI0012D3F41B|nr:uncharacterized protein LOC116346059 isoform X2 [Contarinia nasturtii]
MMGITLLDQDFDQDYYFGQLNTVDNLILCKEFVRISKYIHSYGIQHKDIASRNIMFRRNNGFIIDFNRAEKMYNKPKIDSSARQAGIQFAKNDWISFLQFMENRNERNDNLSRVLAEMRNHIYDESKVNEIIFGVNLIAIE